MRYFVSYSLYRGMGLLFLNDIIETDQAVDTRAEISGIEMDLARKNDTTIKEVTLLNFQLLPQRRGAKQQ